MSRKRFSRFSAKRGPSHSGEAAICSRRRARSAPAAAGTAQGHGDLDVFLQVAGDGFCQADVGEVTERMPAGKRVTRAGHHGHAHPQRLAGRHPAVVRERIQGDVDLPVMAEESAWAEGPCSSNRAGSVPCAANSSSNRRATAGSSIPRNSSRSREPGTRCRIRDHAATTSVVSLAGLWKAANV